MIAGVEGKVVAIVGRAGSLRGSGLGAEIDSADVVVRVNWTVPVSGDEHVGHRTDIVYCCRGCSGQREAAREQGVQWVTVKSKYRKALARRVGDVKKYRPNTGTVAIFDALDSGAREVRVYGMDFYATANDIAPTLPPKGDPCWAWRHAPARDRKLVRSLLTDPRFRPDAVLRKALQA
jgi:hypothetical protein